MKSMYKSELARRAGVSRRTFAAWLRPERETLIKMGVSPRAKLLPPHAVEYLCRKYCID